MSFDRNTQFCSVEGGTAVKKLVSLLCLALFFLVCAEGAFAEEPLPQAFLDALADAAVAERSEIVRDLVDITPYNQDLISRDIGGKTHILVASLVGGPYYDPYSEDALYDRQHPALWVTVVPELKDFFADQTDFPDDVSLRVIQLLGLRPEDAPGGKSYSRIVEFWVQPEDLLRPCPDPEITDMEAELDFPTLVKEYSPDFYLKNDWNNGGTPLSLDWMEWFNGNMNYDPDDPWAYPWTRMGYTYDWGDEEDHVGLSEFLLQTDAVIYVHSVQSMDLDYFTSTSGTASSGGCNSFAVIGISLLLMPMGVCLFRRTK